MHRRVPPPLLPNPRRRPAPAAARRRPLADLVAQGALDRLDRWRSLALLSLVGARELTDQRDLVDADVRRWLEVLGASDLDGDPTCGLHRLLYAFPEFRSLYYHRLAAGNAAGRLAARAAARVFRPVDSLSLATEDLGPGLFIAHGQATVLAAERIGANCYVHQNVTVGWDYRSPRGPVIGDGVFIGAGAKILGAVDIGDGARIGANAVVLSDVPPGATAVGAPARVVRGHSDGPLPPWWLAPPGVGSGRGASPQTSTRSVAGPSFASSTVMSAPKRPVPTRAPSARSAPTTASTSGSATSPGAAASHDGRRPFEMSP